MTGLFGCAMFVMGALTFGVLVRGGYTERMDLIGWTGATLCVVGGLMTIVGYAFEAGIGVPNGNARQVATFVSVVAGIISFTVAAIWQMRRRPHFDQTPIQPRTNYVDSDATYAYGTYTPADVRAARQRASNIRKGVRA
jgi:hypothetical protein